MGTSRPVLELPLSVQAMITRLTRAHPAEICGGVQPVPLRTETFAAESIL